MKHFELWLICFLLAPVQVSSGQEPVSWGSELHFSTFSIVAIDPITGESGTAVTTRVPCVGNAVPWVRAGVGAVATQSWTRVEYGPELLDHLDSGIAPQNALAEALKADSAADLRQVGVIDMRGRSAQHTGDRNSAWAGHRAGINYAVQGNLLVGPEVVDAVGEAFESTAGSMRHLGDRLIHALAAGQVAGGDARKGRLQSAAVIVADPREGRSRRPDKVTVDINVCEHPAPVEELRRIYNTISRTLGYRQLMQFSGNDVWQLKVLLHLAGYFKPDLDALERTSTSGFYTEEAIDAVERFRTDHDMATSEIGSPRGLVDEQFVESLWAYLEEAGLAEAARLILLDVTAVRR